MSFEVAFDVTDVVRSGIANGVDATFDVVVVVDGAATTTIGSLKMNRLLELSLSPLTVNTDGSATSATRPMTGTGSENLKVDVFDVNDADDEEEKSLMGLAGESKTVSAVLDELLEAAPMLELLLTLKLLVRRPVVVVDAVALDGAVAGTAAACVVAGFCRNPKLGNCFTSRPVVIGFERWAGSGSGRCSTPPRSTALSPSFARTLPPDFPKSLPNMVGLNTEAASDDGGFRSLPKPPESAGTEKGI